jgi:phosphoribosyl 1,2-cyclic phosphodiesterase
VRPTTYVPEVMRNVSATMLHIVRKMRRRAGGGQRRVRRAVGGGSYPFCRNRGHVLVSNPDADHIGGFLDVFDAFPVETVYVSGDPNNTLTYNTFLRGVRDEGATTEVLRAGALMDWGGVRADT